MQYLYALDLPEENPKFFHNLFKSYGILAQNIKIIPQSVGRVNVFFETTFRGPQLDLPGFGTFTLTASEQQMLNLSQQYAKTVSFPFMNLHPFLRIIVAVKSRNILALFLTCKNIYNQLKDNEIFWKAAFLYNHGRQSYLNSRTENKRKKISWKLRYKYRMLDRRKELNTVWNNKEKIINCLPIEIPYCELKNIKYIYHDNLYEVKNAYPQYSKDSLNAYIFKTKSLQYGYTCSFAYKIYNNTGNLYAMVPVYNIKMKQIIVENIVETVNTIDIYHKSGVLFLNFSKIAFEIYDLFRRRKYRKVYINYENFLFKFILRKWGYLP